MEKIETMTSREIREKYGTPEEKAITKKMLEDAPEFDEVPFKGKRIGRGFAAFKEYINRKGRPKAEDPKVGIAIRIPLSKAAWLRETGPGWQTRTSKLVVEAVEREAPELRRQA